MATLGEAKEGRTTKSRLALWFKGLEDKIVWIIYCLTVLEGNVIKDVKYRPPASMQTFPHPAGQTFQRKAGQQGGKGPGGMPKQVEKRGGNEVLQGREKSSSLESDPMSCCCNFTRCGTRQVDGAHQVCA